MISYGKGYAFGKRILNLQKGIWRVLPSPIFGDVRVMDVVNEGSVWIANCTEYYESELFHYNGRSWKKIDHPLANNISAMMFDPKGQGWIAGIGEIAYFKSGKWKFIPSPTRGIYKALAGFGSNRLWIINNRLDLFFWDGVQWTTPIPDEKIINLHFSDSTSGVIQTRTSLYEYRSEVYSILSKDSILRYCTKMTAPHNRDVWCIVQDTLIAHFNGLSWKIMSSPAREPLIAISSASTNSIWAVGKHGRIIHFADSHTLHRFTPPLGFNRMIIPTAARIIKDEYGVAIGDVNGDGLLDIYTAAIFEPNRLFMRTVNAYNFIELAAQRGVDAHSPTESITPGYLNLGTSLFDIDNDGDLDIYQCTLNNKNQIFINKGNGFFLDGSERSRAAGSSTDRTNTVAVGDVDLDGDLDIFVTNEESTNRLFINNGNGIFRERTDESGLTTTGGGMCATFGDIDNDGDLDLYVTNWSAQNELYKNTFSETGRVLYLPITAEAGVGGDFYTKSNGAVFFDYDNDGDLDLFVANRKSSNTMYQNNGKGIFTDVTKLTVGTDSMLTNGAAAIDVDNDGWTDLFISNIGTSALYRNMGNGTFAQQTEKFELDFEGYATGIATGDMDNDGDIDIYLGCFTGNTSALFNNRHNSRDYIQVEIEGTKSNRQAIGAKVWLYETGGVRNSSLLRGYKEINGGSGYGSFSSTLVHFGTQTDKSYDILIEFPASAIQKIISSIQSGRRIKVQEEEGWILFESRSKKMFERLIVDAEFYREFIKGLIVLILLILSNIRIHRRYHWPTTYKLILHFGIVGQYFIQTYIFWYDSFLMQTLLPLSSVFTLYIVGHLWYEQFLHKKESIAEREQIRNQISRDLHDDVASTISSTALYVESLKKIKSVRSKKILQTISKIDELLTETQESVSDLVWSVSPQNDSLDLFTAKIRRYAQELCRINKISFDFHAEGISSTTKLPDIIRRNLYLITKEALSNVIRHARATAFSISVKHQSNELKLIIQDNGIGIDPLIQQVQKGYGTSESHGYGLKNMEARAQDMNAVFSIDSKPGQGTKILLRVKMT